MALTDQAYFEDESKWGEAQFITLQNVIDNIMLTASDDSYFKHAMEFRMAIHGKQGLKKLNMALKQENKAISFQVGPERIFPFPRYMSNWSRVSVLNSCKKLTELGHNNEPTIKDYLQDNEYRLLYSNEGAVLNGKDLDFKNGECAMLEFDICEQQSKTNCPQDDFSESWVKAEKKAGYFKFSDDLVDRVVVVEFQSTGLDGIDSCDVKIHNDLEEAMTYWIKWKTMEGDRNAPYRDMLYFKKMYKIEKEYARDLLSDSISIDQILKSVSLRYNN